MKFRFALFLLMFSHFYLIYSQKPLARFEVRGISDLNHSFPTKADITGITTDPDENLILLEVRGKTKIPTAFQTILESSRRELAWMITPEKNPSAIRVFELSLEKRKTDHSVLKATKESGALIIINKEGKQLLQYNYQTVDPPPGIDPVFKRSAFIHPVWSPRGQVLTRIQPPDHYHHYGIWNPWTHILFEGDTLDLWNLNKKHGTVRFADFTSIKEGQVFASYSALHEHVSFKNNSEKVLLNEVQTISIYQTEADQYLMDITIELKCASNSPVTILEYRYAGLGWRTTEQWTNQNSHVLTSEGKTRKDADGSKARWCLVQGVVDGANAGILMMSSPDNYTHPEPLRIWPENQYDRGDMFANFNPTKERDWLLEPGKTYTLKYRFVVFNGSFDKNKSEQAWKFFSTPPAVAVKKVQ